MSRTEKIIKKRKLLPDPIYKDLLVARLINKVMERGKKSVAQKLVYDGFAILKTKGKEPLSVLKQALENVGPRMEVRPRRIGGASYQVPTEVRDGRRTALAIRWLIQAARKRPNKEYHTFAEKLAAELLDASLNQGEAIKKKELTHRMAEANKAFAHFRW